jgi:hypothetical protein
MHRTKPPPIGSRKRQRRWGREGIAKALRLNANRSSMGLRSYNPEPSIPPKRAPYSLALEQRVSHHETVFALPRARLGTTLRTNWEKELHLFTSLKKAHHTRHSAAANGSRQKSWSMGLVTEEEYTKQARPDGHHNRRIHCAREPRDTPLSPRREPFPFLPSSRAPTRRREQQITNG